MHQCYLSLSIAATATRKCRRYFDNASVKHVLSMACRHLRAQVGSLSTISVGPSSGPDREDPISGSRRRQTRPGRAWIGSIGPASGASGPNRYFARSQSASTKPLPPPARLPAPARPVGYTYGSLGSLPLAWFSSCLQVQWCLRCSCQCLCNELLMSQCVLSSCLLWHA
jgi:hypothetical protein